VEPRSSRPLGEGACRGQGVQGSICASALRSGRLFLQLAGNPLAWRVTREERALRREGRQGSIGRILSRFMPGLFGFDCSCSCN
jgi:hypothetical protein